MTAKDKALELYNKFLNIITGLEGSEWWEASKQCALIAVEELFIYNTDERKHNYWIEVREELMKL